MSSDHWCWLTEGRFCTLVCLLAALNQKKTLCKSHYDLFLDAAWLAQIPPVTTTPERSQQDLMCLAMPLIRSTLSRNLKSELKPSIKPFWDFPRCIQLKLNTCRLDLLFIINLFSLKFTEMKRIITPFHFWQWGVFNTLFFREDDRITIDNFHADL